MQAADGYTLVIPANWCRIPLLHGTNAAVKKILDDSFKHLPRDKVAPYRIEVERRLKSLIADARRNAGVDLYFPVERTDAGPLPASFLISRATYDADPRTSAALDPAQVLATLAASHPSARAVEVDRAPGIRTERVVLPAPPAPRTEFTYPTRRVEYTIAIPGDARTWLVSAFATPGAADPDGDFARLLTELFDAIMLTFRWNPAR
jgi:hypothetical protein